MAQAEDLQPTARLWGTSGGRGGRAAILDPTSHVSVIPISVFVLPERLDHQLHFLFPHEVFLSVSIHAQLLNLEPSVLFFLELFPPSALVVSYWAA